MRARAACRPARCESGLLFEFVNAVVVLSGKAGKHLEISIEAQVHFVERFDHGGHGASELLELAALLLSQVFACFLAGGHAVQPVGDAVKVALDALPTLFGRIGHRRLFL